MNEKKLTKVEREYLEARQRGIKAALAFDPGHGRPGIRAVREAQQALAERAEEFHKRTLDNMYPERKKIYRCRESRRTAHILWLNEIERWKREAEHGYPNYIFTGKQGNEPVTVIYPDDISPNPDSGITSKIGEWFYRTEETLEYPYRGSYKNFSRVAERRVIFGQMRDGQPHKITVVAKSWRGNWLLNALVDAGIGGKSTAPMNVRLHKAYDAELVKEYTLDGKLAKVWKRSLAGADWDFCLVCAGMTYHGLLDELESGWREKQQERKNRAGQPVTFEAARDLGFCETGIRQFCATVGIDPAGTYTASEIKELITGHRNQLDQFAREIRIFRRAFGV